MSTQIFAKKDIIKLVTVALNVFFVLFGCQRMTPRVYKVAYLAPNSSHRMEHVEGYQGPYNRPFVPDQQKNIDSINLSQVCPISPNVDISQEVSREYHTGPGDVLYIKIYQLLEPQRDSVEEVEVDPQGNIYLPVLNHVQVAGMTCEQIRRDLLQRLSREYIRDPKVDVHVKKYTSKAVMVLGQVRSPGQISLRTDNAALLDVITDAGGIIPGAAPNIEIWRGAYNLIGTSSNASEPYLNSRRSVSPKEIVPIGYLFAEAAAPRLNPTIYPGDVIKVPAANDGYIYVSGEVRQPGVKAFNQPLTILQALTSAGGTNNVAQEKKCKIIRRNLDGSEREIMVDLTKVRDGKQQNIQVARNDTIIVPGDPVKKFFDGLDKLIRRGVDTGVRVTYDAGSEMGMPSGGSVNGY